MPGNLARKLAQRRRQRLGLVQAGDLDDEFRHPLDQLLDHAVPGDQPRPFVSRVAKTGGAGAIRGEPVDGGRERFRSGLGHKSVDAVFDELERPAGVGRGDDRLPREKRLERDVAVVLVERAVDHGERTSIEVDERLFVERPAKSIRSDTPSDCGERLGVPALRSVAHHHQTYRPINVRHRADGQIRAA